MQPELKLRGKEFRFLGGSNRRLEIQLTMAWRTHDARSRRSCRGVVTRRIREG